MPPDRFSSRKPEAEPALRAHSLREEPRATRRSYHLYGMRVEANAFGCTRERVVEALRAEGVPAGPGYPHPIYRNPLFERKGEGAACWPVSCPYYGREIDYGRVSCPNAEAACRQVLWLSQQTLLGTEADMADVVAAVHKIKRNVAALA